MELGIDPLKSKLIEYLQILVNINNSNSLLMADTVQIKS